jgi:hypothetical protein
MTIESIDVLQTQQIEDLQDDIEDLAAKINLAVTDVTALTTKINTVITDITNLVETLMGSDPNNQYSPSGTTDDDGVLQRLNELYAVFWDHIHMPPFAQSNQGWNSSHPPFQGFNNIMPAHASPVPNSLAAISQSSVSGYTPTAVAATVTGSYTPDIKKSAIVLETNPEARARQLARKNLSTVRN